MLPNIAREMRDLEYLCSKYHHSWLKFLLELLPWHFQPGLYTSLAHSPGQRVPLAEKREVVIVYGNQMSLGAD